MMHPSAFSSIVCTIVETGFINTFSTIKIKKVKIFLQVSRSIPLEY
jgi:hypothetical protein